MNAHSEIVPRTTILDICNARNAALEAMTQASGKLGEVFALADEAKAQARRAASGRTSYLHSGSSRSKFSRMFKGDYNAENALVQYREQLDADVWTHVLDITGLKTMMDRTAIDDFESGLLKDVAPVTVDNVTATFQTLMGQADVIFQRGLAKCFSDLDRRFKSHDGFKIGSRVILTRVFTDYGSFCHSSRHQYTLVDIERVFSVLDGKPANPDGLRIAIERSRSGGYDARQSECETEYFRIRGFMNGNAHIWFLRNDLVERANKILAEYYGEVVGDAMPADEGSEALRDRPGLPAKNLAFFATPAPAVERLLDGVYFKPGMAVLEPSAGTGNIVKALLAKSVKVTAIEVHPDRAATLAEINHPDLTVRCANFLQVPALPRFDVVVMNPPFSCTHWMQHVMHAWEFIKPGGDLVTILPISADVNETKKHVAFRKWAKQRKASRWGRMFSELPAESFAASGTRINTVILHLTKPNVT